MRKIKLLIISLALILNCMPLPSKIHAEVGSNQLNPNDFTVEVSGFSSDQDKNHYDARNNNEVKNNIFDYTKAGKYKYWRSNVNSPVSNNYLIIDMQKEYQIDKISYAPQQYFKDNIVDSYECNGAIKEIVLQVSDDKQTWRNVQNANGVVMNDYAYPKDITFHKETARYIKISANKAVNWEKKDWNEISVGKIKIFGNEITEKRSNIALRKPVTTENGKNPELAVDGIIEEGNNNWWEGNIFYNGNADWTSKGEPYNPKGYLTVDLQGTYDIDEFKVYGYWEDNRSFAYNISTSLDGTQFTPIIDKKLEDGSNAKTGIAHKLQEKIKANYVRIQVTDSNAQWPCSSQIREFEVYGTKSKDKGQNVAHNKVVTNLNTQEKITDLTDEDNQTAIDVVKNHSIDLNLVDVYQVENIDVFSGVNANNAVSYVLRGSKDGKNYKVLDRGVINDKIHNISIENYKGMHLKFTFFDNIKLNEIKVYGTKTQLISDKINIAKNKKITGINTEANHGPENANDGNINNYWAASSVGSYITVDLGDFYKINKFNVIPYFDNHRAYKYTISVSKDGKKFHTVATKDDENIATEVGTNHDIKPEIARYVRLTMTDHLFSDNKSVHVNEFKVFGEEVDYEVENIALHKDISAKAEKLVNDDYFDTWAASSVNEEVILNLEKCYSISDITMIASDQKTNQYRIYASEDGKEYDMIAQKNAKGNITIPLTFVNAQYLKIVGQTEDKPLSLNEIIVHGEETPVATDGDIAFLKPVRTNFGATSAENITDQQVSTAWNGQYYPCYVDIDLMGTYNVDRAKVYMSNANGYYRYSIYTSKDGEKFNRVYRKEDKTPISKDGVMEATLTNAKGVRFVRVQFEYSSETQNVGVGDIRLYGTKINSKKEYRKELTYTNYKDTKYAKDITDQEVYDYVDGVITRLFGEQYTDWFTFELKDKEAKKDFFEIYDENGKIHIAGNKGLSLTSGLYYYLKNYENVLVTEVEVQGNLTATPNKVNATKDKPIRKDNLYDVRYAYNYCTNSYTMAFFGEDEWQRELDWLALNGVNVILDLNGQEAVWHNFLKKIGYTDEEAKDWLAGPGYYAWQFMANLETFNGPVSNNWILQRLEMARKNHYKMRTLGMEPVFQGFSGEVPTNIKTIDPKIDIVPQRPWSAFDRPSMIRTTSPSYTKYSKMFYDSQKEILGDKTRYYATDPFHEGGSVADMNLADIGDIIFHKLREHNPGAVWVVQSWSLNQQTISKFTQEERENGLLVLDLNADQDPKWKGSEFGGSPWVWCVLDNYGGKHGIQAELELMSKLYTDVYQKSKHLKGIGIAPEGTRLNTVQYDLLYETAWENQNIDLPTWLEKYVLRRYGKQDAKDIPNAEKAWDILRTTAYKAHKQGEVFAAPDTIINFAPRFNVDKEWPWGREVAAIYDQKQFEQAAELLFKDYEKLKDNEGFKFDATDVVREYLSNTAMQYYKKFTKAYKDNDQVAFEYYANRFLAVIDMTDKVLNTHKEFLVGDWIQKAKDLGNEYQEDEFSKDMLERNARALITTWGSYRMSEQEYNHEGTGLHGQGVLVDYANRQYAGLTKDYYGKRWETWINNLKSTFGKDHKDYRFKENFELGWNWVLNQNEYATTASGDIKTLAEETFLKYGLDDDYRLKVNITKQDGSKEVKDMFVHKGINQEIKLQLNQNESIKEAVGANVQATVKNNVITITDITANTELNVTVGNAEVQLDKEQLQKLVDTVNECKENEFTISSWKNISNALLNANDVLKNAKTQDEINNAYEKLNEAYKALEKRADTSKAKEFLETVKEYNANNYTKDTWNSFVEARQVVENMIKNVNDISQSQMDKALNKAIEAQTQLVYKTADYSKVEAAIEKAESLNKDDYKDFSKVEAALNAVVKNKDITKQKEVDAMAEAIEKAIAELEKKPGLTPLEPSKENVPMTPLKPSTSIDTTKSEESTNEKVENDKQPATGVSTNTAILWTVVLGAGVAILLINKKRKVQR